MNTKDEIIDVIEGRFRGPLPPPVLLTQTGTTDLMDLCGAEWPDAHYDVDKMVRLALQPSERFGFATVRVPFDITQEAEALGAEVIVGTRESQPMVVASPWRDKGTVPPVPDDLISPEEMIESERLRVVIEAAERIHEVRGDLFGVSNCLCATGVAAHLLGMETLVIGTMFQSETVEAWIDKLVPYSSLYAKTLSEVSDCVSVITDIQADMLPPEINSLIAKKEKKVISSITNSFSMIHNCGNTLACVEDIVGMKPDILSLETSSDPEAYLKAICKRCVTLGCINPVQELMGGTPESVRAKALESAEMGFGLIGPECGVPPQTRNANIEALAHYRD